MRYTSIFLGPRIWYWAHEFEPRCCPKFLHQDHFQGPNAEPRRLYALAAGGFRRNAAAAENSAAVHDQAADVVVGKAGWSSLSGCSEISSAKDILGDFGDSAQLHTGRRAQGESGGKGEDPDQVLEGAFLTF